MPSPNIDFRNLRIHRNSLNDGFEELTRQLVLVDPPAGYTSIENRGPGGDGGVEILVRFEGDRVWGWQSKFFDGFDTSEVSQLKSSLSRALDHFPGLERYVVAIPRNLSGPDEGEFSTQRRKWREFTDWAASRAGELGRSLTLELWDDSVFVRKLQSNDPRYAGIRAYWFDKDALSDSWFRNKFDTARERIGSRYSPEDHVELAIRSVFDIVTRNPSLAIRVAQLRDGIRESLLASEDLARVNGGELAEFAVAFTARLRSIADSIVPNISQEALANVASALPKLRELFRTGQELKNLRDAVAAKAPHPSDTGPQVTQHESRQGALLKARRLLGEASQVFSTVDEDLLNGKPLLVLGEAGSGKTHLLADEVARSIERGAPAIFIPARALHNVDQPGASILEFLEIADTPFGVWLGMLSAAASAAGQDALLVIDGINETPTASDWEASLPVLLRDISAFSNIRIVVSCRSVYAAQCIRETLDVVRIVHPGFQGSLSQAAKTYLDNHGIERSSAPIFELNGILTNPLFLTSVVRGLNREGITSFPRDLNSLPRILAYWVRSVERSLVDRRYDRIVLGDGRLEKIVRELAAEMARRGEEQLPIAKAHQIAEAVIDLAAPARAQDRIVARLVDEGLLLDFPAETSGDRTVSFSFQKFGDYFIADAIINAAADIAQLVSSLLPGGQFAHVFEKKRGYYFKGVRVAILSLCPGRFGLELPMASADADRLAVSIDDFLESVPLREAAAVSKRTVEMLERLRDPAHEVLIEDRDWYDLLAKLATVPGLALNADYLMRYLAAMPLGQRDATWSYYLVGSLDEYDDDSTAIQQLVDWAWNAPQQQVDAEQARLAAQMLALLTSTMDRGVRDRATKALAALLRKVPAAIAPLVGAFSNWDDPYVRERILAAAFSGTLASRELAELEAIAAAIDGMVFAKSTVERHAWTRRYAQMIVDHIAAVAPALDPGIKIRSCPPYASAPIASWPTLGEVAAYKDDASSIISSVVGYMSKPYDRTFPGMAGDFGRYTMGSIDNYFSEAPRTAGLPIPRETEIETLKETLKFEFPEAAARFEELEALHEQARTLRWKTFTELPHDNADERYSEADAAESDPASRVEDLIVTVQDSLLSGLPADLLKRYRDLEPFSSTRSKEISKFSLTQAQCWVATRSIELGWSRQMHAEIERVGLNYTHDRRGHEVERIGKKYQHIALQELIGYLADHHWYSGYSEAPRILMSLEEFDPPDIDPTFLAGSFSRRTEGYNPGGLKRPELIFVATMLSEDIAWTESSQDIPDLTQLLVQGGDDGHPWAIVNSFVRSPGYMDDFEANHSTRSGQLSIEMVLVPLDRWSELDVLDRESLLADRGDVFRHDGSSAALFGMNSARALSGRHPQVEFDDAVCGVPYSRITDYYAPDYSEFDYSGASEERSFFVPRPPLLVDLDLEPRSPFSSYYIDRASDPVFASERDVLDNWCVVRFDLVEKFAAARGLAVTWRVWFEKDGGISPVGAARDHNQWARRDHLGYYRLTSDGWVGNMQRYRV